jgi:hypothetical protein
MELKYRASSMGNLMTEGRSKAELLGATCKKELVKVYAYNRYGITKPVESKYFEKGHKNEELGITYLSKHLKTMFTKNEERIFKAQFTGLPDLYEGESIQNAERIIDIKNAWSYITFLEAKTEELAKDRIWQGHTYNYLTGAKQCDFAIVCTSAPPEMIKDEKRRAFFKMNEVDEESEAFIEKCLEIERNMIMDMDEYLEMYPHVELLTISMGLKNSFINIPWKERILIKTVERDEYEIGRMQNMIPHWDKYILNTIAK